MTRPGPPAEPLPEPTTQLREGWHCLHLYYAVNQSALAQLSQDERSQGIAAFREILDPSGPNATQRLQSFITSGHRADFGLMLLDPDPLKIDAIQQAIRSSKLGPAFTPAYSFVSITEVSEYVPTAEQYAEKLIATGSSPDDPSYKAKVKAYEQRLPMMNQQRLYPEAPDWPVICFYPMNKMRHPHANWYQLSFAERSSLMAEHATSGIKFAGKVSQLITASTGFDDWEWGVTLWGRSPEYIKEIVYTMRFDTASARYAEFGPFYIGYIKTADEIAAHLKLA
ncbi:MAG TPA: hydrogen peroxide-dependent heme synthase [Planctomicrobium sp.]|nr:hydrogen peroxide-dependent heme synthase [Planctomicrobium sp.]